MNTTSLATARPTPGSRSTRDPLHWAVEVAALAALYFVLGQISIRFAFHQIDVSPVWLPAGLALVATLLRGPRLLPGIFIGALADDLTRSGFAVASGIALAVSLATWVGATVLRRPCEFDLTLSRPRHVVLLITVGATVAPLLSALVGTTTLVLGGAVELQGAPRAIALWTAGDALGILLVTTLILTWSNAALDKQAPSTPRLLMLLSAIQVFISAGAFLLPIGLETPVAAFASLPLAVILSALLPLRWVAVMNLVLFSIAGLATLFNAGPFSLGSADHRTLSLTGYSLAMCVTTLVVAALALERRRIADELRHSLERFRSLTALSADWMWEQDDQLRYTYFSSGAPDKAGVDPGRSIGKTRFEIPFEWGSEAAKQEHAEDLAARRPFRDLQLGRVDDDGRVRHLSVSGEPVCSANGEFCGYRGVAHDITAMVRAADAVRESEARFRSLVELSNDWYWETDAGLRFTYLSQGFEQVSGLIAQDLLGKRSLELHDAGLSQEQRDEHDRVLRERQPFRNLVRRRPNREGDMRYAAVSGEPVFDHKGEFRGYRGVGRDITAQCLAEQAVHEASKRYRELVELSNDWFWEQDESLRFTRIESAGTQKQRANLQEYVGRRRWDFPVLNMTPADWEAHLRLLHEHRVFRDLELIKPDNDGEVMHLLVSGVPVFDAEGAFRGYRGTTRDVTDARRAEQRAQRLSASYAALSEANDAIIHCRNEDELYAQLCRIAVTHGGFTYCRISGVDGADRGVRTLAEAGDKRCGLSETPLSVDPAIPEGQGPAAEALRRGEPSVVNDVGNDPAMAAWKDALEIGSIRSLATFPLRRADVVVGGLHLYAAESGIFDDELLRLLEKLALNISFALDNLARESARHQAEAALRESETRFRDFTEAAAEYAWETDLDSRITFISARAETVSGYRCDELTGRHPRDFMPPGEPERVYTWLKAHCNLDGSFSNLVHQVLSRSGEIRWVQLNGVPMLDDKGNRIGFRGTGADITDRKAADERINYLATRDPLTELPNRVLLTDRLAKATAGARRGNYALALMFVDLDRFKNINDSLGHEIGDLVLKGAAARLVGCVRQGDTLARLGGDEFVVLLENLRHAEDAAHVAEKILASLSQPFEIAGHTLNTSCSIGISIFPNDAVDERALMKNADIAMYHAKEQGRSNYQFFSPEMTVRAVERLNLETALRQGLDREEFLLHYQPQIDIRSGRIVGVEALIRWQHPAWGLMPPAKFIPVAEEAGLIDRMGEWTLLTACRQVRAWQEAGLPPLKIAVNISARQLQRPAEFARKVLRIIEESGLDPALVELEMTESLLLQNADENISVLNELGRRSIRIAVDDFGTGYSSLSYLKQLPIDTLKIDRSFTRNLPGDREGLAIVRAIVAMGHSLGLSITAEGVETEEQLAVLRRMRCDEYQGFLFSKPLPVNEFVELLRSQPVTAKAKA